MQTENWERVKELLDQVLELDSNQRQEYLDKLNLKTEVRAEVESLMAFENEADHLMNLSAIEFSKDFFSEEDTNALIGTQIGTYQIIRELGHGGMGAVYLAERNDGKFEQKVALKLLKREMNTAALRRRFQQERHILGSLEHPNIARLLDAGTTDDKVPFLAMEYVEGLPIDDYCHKHQLDLNHRLDLFRQVCQAVNFAHRNLVVHRDLKPSNILVNQDGIPKLLDFGISKIVSSDFEQDDTATVTRLGAMTPGYASPEQLKRESVSTATDIYSLGVILYELLSGHRPFEGKEHDFREIYKAVMETDPLPPSALMEKISKKRTAGTEAENELNSAEGITNQEKHPQSHSDTGANKIRFTRPNTLSLTSNSLRGDLDNIVLKALRKEPERRYSSAENLAEDIHRHQRGLPVTARPNTFSYRAEKFYQRNKVSVFAGILILLTVIGGVVATIWQSRVAAAERDRARLEAEKVKKINAYTQNILNFSNPHWLSSNPKRDRDAKISDALDEALKNIDTDLANEPEIQAEVMFTMGHTYTYQGQYEKAEPLLRRAVENFNQVSGGENLKAMQASIILGSVLYYQAKYKEAEQYYTSAINYFRTKITEDKSQTKWLAIAINDLGNLRADQANIDEALKHYEQSLELTTDFTGKDRFIVPIVQLNIGAIKSIKSDFQAALEHYQQAQDEIRRAGNESTLENAALHRQFGITYYSLRDLQQAESHYRKSYDIYITTLGEDHIDTASMLKFLALNAYKQGNFDEAEKLAQKHLQIVNKLHPGGHIAVAVGVFTLGEIYTRGGKLKKGEELLRKSLDWYLKNTKDPNYNLSYNKTLLGENLLGQKRYAEARELTQAGCNGYQTTFGEDHQYVKKCREQLSKIPE